MPGTLPHTQNGFAQTAAEQHFREDLGDEGATRDEDPTTLKFDGKVAIADEEPAATRTTGPGVSAARALSASAVSRARAHLRVQLVVQLESRLRRQAAPELGSASRMIARSLAPTWCSCHTGKPRAVRIAGAREVRPVRRHLIRDFPVRRRRSRELRVAAIREQRQLADVVEHVRHLGRVRRRERRLAGRRRRVLREEVQIRFVAALELVVGIEPADPERAVVRRLRRRSLRFFVRRMRIEREILVRERTPARRAPAPRNCCAVRAPGKNASSLFEPTSTSTAFWRPAANVVDGSSGMTQPSTIMPALRNFAVTSSADIARSCCDAS